MSWYRIEGEMPQHEKYAPLSDAAFRLAITAGAWCANRFTDGYIPMRMVSSLTSAPRGKRLKSAIEELLSAGIWEIENGHEADFHIHDFLDWNMSREQWENRIAAAKAGGKAKAAKSLNSGLPHGMPHGIPNACQTPAKRLPHGMPNACQTPAKCLPLALPDSDSDPEYEDPEDQNPHTPFDSDHEPGRDQPAAPSELELPTFGVEFPDSGASLPSVASDATAPASDGAPRVTETRLRATSRELPAHVRNFERSMSGQSPKSAEAVALFEAYRAEAGKPGARYDHKARDLFERLIDEGETPESVRLVVRGAKLDHWARDTAKLAAAPLLSSADQREKYIAIAKCPPRAAEVKTPRRVQPNAVNGPMPEEWTEDSE